MEYNGLHTILLTVHTADKTTTKYWRKRVQHIVDNTKTIGKKKHSNLIDNTVHYYTDCWKKKAQ